MKERILTELKRRIEKDLSKGPLFRMGYINLQMKKFVMDMQDENGKEEFNGDCLQISYFSNKFGLIAEFAKPEFDKVFKFDNLEEVAQFLVETYC